MASRGINVPFVADTRAFLKGTKDIEGALTDVSDSLDSVARDGKTAEDVVSRSLSNIGQDANDAGTTLQREFKQAFDHVEKDAKTSGTRAGKNIGQGVQHELAGSKQGTKKIGSEIGGELAQNIGEGVSNGQGNIVDAVLGTLGGVLPALGPVAAVVGVGIFAAQAIISGISSQNEKVKQAGINLFTALQDGVLSNAERTDLLETMLGVDNLPDLMRKVNDQAKTLNVDRAALLHAYLYPESANSNLLDTIKQIGEGQQGINYETEDGRKAFLAQRNAANDVLNAILGQQDAIKITTGQVGEYNAALITTNDVVATGGETRLTYAQQILDKERAITDEYRKQVEQVREYSVTRQAALNTEGVKHDALMKKINADIEKAATTKSTADDLAAEKARRNEEVRHALVLKNIGIEQAEEDRANQANADAQMNRLRALNKLKSVRYTAT